MLQLYSKPSIRSSTWYINKQPSFYFTSVFVFPLLFSLTFNFSIGTRLSDVLEFPKQLLKAFFLWWNKQNSFALQCFKIFIFFLFCLNFSAWRVLRRRKKTVRIFQVVDLWIYLSIIQNLKMFISVAIKNVFVLLWWKVKYCK